MAQLRSFAETRSRNRPQGQAPGTPSNCVDEAAEDLLASRVRDRYDVVRLQERVGGLVGLNRLEVDRDLRARLSGLLSDYSDLIYLRDRRGAAGEREHLRE